MITRLNKVKDNVANILNSYPETRSNDNELFKAYLKVYCGLDIPNIGNLVPYESLSRARRYWHSQGMFLPLDESVVEGRKKVEKDYIEAFSKRNNPKAIA